MPYGVNIKTQNHKNINRLGQLKRFSNPEEIEKNRQRGIKRFEDPKEREKVSKRITKYFSNPKNRKKQSELKKKFFKEHPEKRSNLGKTGELASMFGRKGDKSPVLNENNGRWKGNNATAISIHQWVSRKKGKPHICEDCGKYIEELRNIHWSNKDHLYKRNIDDYNRRCRKCHWDYDKKHGLR